MNEIEQLKAELEQVKKQAAAMREAAIEFRRHAHYPHGYTSAGDDSVSDEKKMLFIRAAERLESALALGAGRDFISRETVKPLVDRLRDVKGYFEAIRHLTANIGEYTAVNAKIESLEGTLEHARTLGL